MDTKSNKDSGICHAIVSEGDVSRGLFCDKRLGHAGGHAHLPTSESDTSLLPTREEILHVAICQAHAILRQSLADYADALNTRTASPDIARLAREAAKLIAEDDGLFHDCNCEAVVCAEHVQPRAAAIIEQVFAGSDPKPIDMLLFCPHCGEQHVDLPQPEKDWDNPPHKSHECQFCGWVWRPSDMPTNGVLSISTQGKVDKPARPRYFATAKDYEVAQPEQGDCEFCEHPTAFFPSTLEGDKWIHRGRDNEAEICTSATPGKDNG